MIDKTIQRYMILTKSYNVKSKFASDSPYHQTLFLKSFWPQYFVLSLQTNGIYIYHFLSNAFLSTCIYTSAKYVFTNQKIKFQNEASFIQYWKSCPCLYSKRVISSLHSYSPSLSPNFVPREFLTNQNFVLSLCVPYPAITIAWSSWSDGDPLYT
jgi:hypothetical protein